MKIKKIIVIFSTIFIIILLISFLFACGVCVYIIGGPSFFLSRDYVEYNGSTYYRMDDMYAVDLDVCNEDFYLIDCKDCVDIEAKMCGIQKRSMKLYKDDRFIYDMSYQVWYLKDYDSFMSIYENEKISKVTFVSYWDEDIATLTLEEDLSSFSESIDMYLAKQGIEEYIEFDTAYKNKLGILVNFDCFPEVFDFGLGSMIFESDSYIYNVYDDCDPFSPTGSMRFEQTAWSERIYNILDKIQK